KFEQPDFKYEKAPNYLELGSNAWDITEAEIIEIEEHYEGQENTGGDTDYTATIDIPMGSYTQQIIGYNSSGSLDTGQKGDKLTIKLNGTNLSVRVHGKFTRREYKEIKTHTNEIDPVELETREEETEQPIEEEIDIDNLEMEEPEGEIGDLTGELEEDNDECDFGFLIGKDNQEPETLNAYAPAPSFIDYGGSREENERIYEMMPTVHDEGGFRFFHTADDILSDEPPHIHGEESSFLIKYHAHPKIINCWGNKEKLTAELDDGRELNIKDEQLKRYEILFEGKMVYFPDIDEYFQVQTFTDGLLAK
ncbi:1334_t:CDS:2, partial [Racocetra fulgida]